jgi:hypothetical protein
VGASLLAKTDFQTLINHGLIPSVNSHPIFLKHTNQHHPGNRQNRPNTPNTRNAVNAVNDFSLPNGKCALVY